MRISKENFGELDRTFLFQKKENRIVYSDLHREFFPILEAEKPKFETLGSISYQVQGLINVGVIEFTGNFVSDLDTFLLSFPEGNLALVAEDILELLPYVDVISDRVTLYLSEQVFDELILTLKNINEHS